MVAVTNAPTQTTPFRLLALIMILGDPRPFEGFLGVACEAPQISSGPVYFVQKGEKAGRRFRLFLKGLAPFQDLGNSN